MKHEKHTSKHEVLESNAELVKPNNGCSNQLCKISKVVSTRDIQVQTDQIDITSIVERLVKIQIKNIQQFESRDLQERLAKIEEENYNLKRREKLLTKRLLGLEQSKRKAKSNIMLSANGIEKSESSELPENVNKRQNEETLFQSEGEYLMTKRPFFSLNKDDENFRVQPAQKKILLTAQSHTDLEETNKSDHTQDQENLSSFYPRVLETDENNGTSLQDKSHAAQVNVALRQISHKQEQNDFCPSLFKPANRRQSTQNSTIPPKDNLPTQKVIPMRQHPSTSTKDINTITNLEKLNNPIPNSKVLQQQQPLSPMLINIPAQSITSRSFLTSNGEVFTQFFDRLPPPPPPMLNTHTNKQRPQLRYDVAPYQRPSNLVTQYRTVKFTNVFERPMHPQMLKHNRAEQEKQIKLLPKLLPPPSYFEATSLPQLTANITSNATNIILTWTCLDDTVRFLSNVDSYSIYAFHTDNLRESPPNRIKAWKQIGAIKVNELPLPIACTLTQTLDGHNYYFAVTPVDKYGVPGSLSNPCALKVSLGK